LVPVGELKIGRDGDHDCHVEHFAQRRENDCLERPEHGEREEEEMESDCAHDCLDGQTSDAAPVGADYRDGRRHLADQQRQDGRRDASITENFRLRRVEVS
jgi:hypothetical protein